MQHVSRFISFILPKKNVVCFILLLFSNTYKHYDRIVDESNLHALYISSEEFLMGKY